MLTIVEFFLLHSNNTGDVELKIIYHFRFQTLFSTETIFSVIDTRQADRRLRRVNSLSSSLLSIFVNDQHESIRAGDLQEWLQLKSGNGKPISEEQSRIKQFNSCQRDIHL